MAAVSPVAPAQGIAPLRAPADDALAGLYRRNARHVYAFCLKWLRSREEAEDAVQTTFMYAWRGLGRGIIPTSEEAWVLAIARNVCRSAIDARKRREPEVARDPHVLEDTVAAPTHDDDVAQISEALLELTEQQRRAILMREWQGLSYKEIADELGLSQSAVETLIFRARRSLAHKLRRVPAIAPWMKSLLGGGTAKIAAGATVAVLGVAAGEVATHQGAHHRAPARTVAVRAALVPAVAVPQRHAVPRTTHAEATMAHRAAVAPRRAAAPTVSGLPPSAPTAAPAPAPPAPPPAAAAPAPAAPAPAAPAPAAPAPPEPATAPTPEPAAAPAAAPAPQPTDTTPVDGAVATVTDTTNAVVGTATDTVDAVADAAQRVVSTVTTALPPVPPVLPLHP